MAKAGGLVQLLAEDDEKGNCSKGVKWIYEVFGECVEDAEQMVRNVAVIECITLMSADRLCNWSRLDSALDHSHGATATRELSAQELRRSLDMVSSLLDSRRLVQPDRRLPR